MANGANVIVFAPLDSAGIVPVVRKANEAGVLVFSIDDAPQGGMVTATVRADNVNAGVQGSQEMAKRLADKACWTDDSCIVLELQGGLTTPNGLDRSNGFADTLKEMVPKVTILQRPTEWAADMAADATQNVLTQNPSLNGIFMASELMASAVNAQLTAAGKGAAVGEADSVIRVAIDGTPQGLQLICEKALDATIKLFNVAGLLIKTENHRFAAGYSTQNVSVTGMANGTYILTLESENGVINKRIVIQ